MTETVFTSSMTNPVHLMTGSSMVRCGAPMRDPKHPDGWDLGTASADHAKTTCPDCLPRHNPTRNRCETCGARCPVQTDPHKRAVCSRCF